MISFTNFYLHFIQSFNKVATPLTLILQIKIFNSKTTSNSNNVKISNGENDINGGGNNGGEKFRKKLIKSKNNNLIKFKKIARNNTIKIGPNFLTHSAKKNFNKLWLVLSRH